MKTKQKFRFQVLRALGDHAWCWRAAPGNGRCSLFSGDNFPTRLAAVEDIGRFIIAVDTAKIEIDDA